MLLQFDDSALWGSIFQTETGKLLFQEKDIRTTYAFTPALQQAVKWEGKLPLRGLSALKAESPLPWTQQERTFPGWQVERFVKHVTGNKNLLSNNTEKGHTQTWVSLYV